MVTVASAKHRTMDKLTIQGFSLIVTEAVTSGSMSTHALLPLGSFLLASDAPGAVGVLRSAISGKLLQTINDSPVLQPNPSSIAVVTCSVMVQQV